MRIIVFLSVGAAMFFVQIAVASIPTNFIAPTHEKYARECFHPYQDEVLYKFVNDLYFGDQERYQKNKAEAVKILAAQENAEDKDIPFRAAWCYLNKFGTNKNPERALACLKLAEARGNILACLTLADLYDEGCRVTDSIVQANADIAFRYYKKAAEKGLCEAMAKVGYCYSRGLGCYRDYEEAYKWTLKAAKQGEVAAICNLVIAYANGIGVEPDNKIALALMRKYSEKDDKLFFVSRNVNAAMQAWLGDVYSEGSLGEKKDKAKAKYWYRRAAENGSGYATQKYKSMLDIGALYYVVDLSEGPDAKHYPISVLDEVPLGGWSDEYKTRKLVLRRVDCESAIVGTPSDEIGRYPNERLPQYARLFHDVYYMGIFEVTQKQWELVMGDNPSRIKIGATYPVSGVIPNGKDKEHGYSAFASKLYKKTGLGFMLPTEEEWEIACNADNERHTPYCFGRGLSKSKACFGKTESAGDKKCGPSPVGSYEPNKWGLFDMHGNVWELTLDRYTDNSTWLRRVVNTNYVDGALSAEDNRSLVVIKGGAWNSKASDCRTGARFCASPWRYRSDFVGFRVRMSLPTGADKQDALAEEIGR